ncbi:MAG: glucose 1-dehydrogenase [SAR86 cluster bacterium]|jgi:NAD(P)-dependent dehydrogenase (short-subunit alcohol dehydrogenase family)|tara:strand:+ start:18686 stop:19510 length:825 start_codon:yes stop_codon:yes gene_type:complete
MNRLANKVAIITGGASGIGAGTVRRFIEEGAKVVIADIQDDLGQALAAELGQNAIYQHTDVAAEADVERMVDLAVNHFGHLDILFNNAGFGGVSGELQDLVIGQEYANTVGVMFTGVVLGIKHAARVMKPQRSGSIISTASVAGLQAGLGPHVYSGIKAGVIGLSRSAALELAAFNIRANAICPGGIATPIFAPMLEFHQGDNQSVVEIMRTRMAQAQPVQRSGEAADIANMALFLASDDSTFITGQHHVVDGGMTSSRMRLDESLKDGDNDPA